MTAAGVRKRRIRRLIAAFLARKRAYDSDGLFMNRFYQRYASGQL